MLGSARGLSKWEPLKFSLHAIICSWDEKVLREPFGKFKNYACTDTSIYLKTAVLMLFFFTEKKLILFTAFILFIWVWGSGLWLPFARYLCNSSSKCTFSEQFLQSYCILESVVSTLFSTVQFIYISKRLQLIPSFLFWWLIGVTFHMLSGHCAPVEVVPGNTCWNAVCM